MSTDPVSTAAGPAARWLGRQATRGAVIGAVAGLVLWWVLSGSKALGGEGIRLGTIVSLVLLLAPAAWLLNVRAAVRDLAELPARLQSLVRRRVDQGRGLLGSDPDAARGVIDVDTGAIGPVDATRAVRSAVVDYRDLVGASARVGQMLSPGFWLLTIVAVAAVALLSLVAPLALLVHLIS